MASYAEIEGWFSILSTGMTGLRLLKDFGIRTSELEYFGQNFGKTEMKVAAFAPSPLYDQYEKAFKESEAKLKMDMPKLADTDLSDESIDSILNDAKQMYDLLGIIYQTALAGSVLM